MPVFLRGSGSATLHELVAGLVFTLLASAFAFWKGFLLAAIAFALAGVLWGLAKARRRNRPAVDLDTGREHKRIRPFFVQPEANRDRLIAASAGACAIGGVILLISAIAGGVQASRAEKEREQQAAGIEDNIAQARNDVAELKNEMADIKEQLQPVVDDITARLREEEAGNNRLSLELSWAIDEPDELRDLVESGLLEQAQSGLDAGQSADEVVDELRRGNPRELLVFLVRKAEEDDAKLADAQQRSIERHREIAAIAYRLGEIDLAEQSLLRILEVTPDDLGAINEIGNVHKLRGNWAQAQASYQSILKLTQEPVWRALAFSGLGQIARRNGDFNAARDYHQCSLAIQEDLGRGKGVSVELLQLGLVEKERDNWPIAEYYFLRSLDVAEQRATDERLEPHDLVRVKQSQAAALGNLGSIEQMRGNLDLAESFHTRSLAINYVIGFKENMSANLNNLGLIEIDYRNYEAAEDYLMQSLAIDEELGDRDGMAHTRLSLAIMRKEQGNMKESIAHAQAAYRLFAELEMASDREFMAVYINYLEQLDATTKGLVHPAH